MVGFGELSSVGAAGTPMTLEFVTIVELRNAAFA